MQAKSLEQKEFITYLKSLEGDKPFDCPDLRVLPEDIYFDNHLTHRRDLSKGDLVCISSVDYNQSALHDVRCQNLYWMKQKNGKLEIGCNNHKRFYLELKPILK